MTSCYPKGMTTTRTVPLLTSASTVTGALHSVKRLRNSIDGNPRFQLTLEIPEVNTLVRWNTRTNAAVGGIVTNFRLGATVTLAINGQGSVIDMVEGSVTT